MATYTIAAVSPTTREYSTKFGDMISYRLKFQESGDDVVELGQKKTSPAPTVGQTLEGTIDNSSSFGPKFKKEYNQGGFGGGQPQRSSASSSGASSFQKTGDNFTMFLSYAKDVAVALIGTKDGFNEEKFDEIIRAVSEGGKDLYDNRPGGENKPQEKAPIKQGDFAPEDIDETIDLDSIDDLMGGKSKPVKVDDIPF